MPNQLPNLTNVSWLSRMLGVGPRFQGTLLQLLRLGYKCRIRLPLFISAGFFLCHIFSVYLPTVEINVEVIEDNRQEEELEEEEEGGEELSDIQDIEEEDTEDEEAADLAVVLNIVGGSSGH
jgi:hypothetical protein